MSHFRSWQRILLFISVPVASLYLLLDMGGSIFGVVALRVIGIGATVLLAGSCIRYRHFCLTKAQVLLRLLRREWLLAGFSLFCALTLASTMFFSWRMQPMGLVLQAGNLHDSVWHVALIKELQKQIPPAHPSSFEHTVTNYHYYYDLGVAAIANTTDIPPTFLHFQIMPVLISVFLAMTIVGFARSVSRQNGFSYWLLFFIFFGGNAGYLIPLAFPTKTWMESSFWVSQTSSMMVNPQLLLSFALLFILFSIPLWGDVIKNNRLFASVLIILASLAGIKMYAFLIAAMLLGAYLFIRLFNSSFKQVVVRLAVFLIISVSMFLRFTDLSKQQLIFSPLWFVNTMVEAPDRLYVLDWKLREDTYLAEGARLHYLALKSWELIIFYGGNLGSRVLLLLLPIVMYLYWKKGMTLNQRQYYALGLALTGFILSTSVPLIFIQSGVAWNTIQFWYYGLIFASILVALTLSLLPVVLPKRNISLPIISLFVIALTVPSWRQTYFARFGSDELINSGIVTMASQLQSDERVMICPFGIYKDVLFESSLVRALSDARIFLADPVQLDLLGLNGYEKKQELVRNMQQQSWVVKTLQSKQISSVICADDEWNQKMLPVLTASNIRLFSL